LVLGNAEIDDLDEVLLAVLVLAVIEDEYVVGLQIT
jgi:hypothetical protein